MDGKEGEILLHKLYRQVIQLTLFGEGISSESIQWLVNVQGVPQMIQDNRVVRRISQSEDKIAPLPLRHAGEFVNQRDLHFSFF